MEYFPFQIAGNIIILMIGLGIVFYISIRWKSLAKYKPKYLRLLGLYVGIVCIIIAVGWLKIIFGRVMP